MMSRLQHQQFGIADLAAAFGVDTRLLRRRLADDGLGARNTWTVRESYNALSGDGSLESLRNAKRRLTDTQQAMAELTFKEQEGKLCDVDTLAKELEPAIVESIRIIEASGMTDDEKFQIRTQLHCAFMGAISAGAPVEAPPQRKQHAGDGNRRQKRTEPASSDREAGYISNQRT